MGRHSNASLAGCHISIAKRTSVDITPFKAATLAHERGKNDPDQVRTDLKQVEFPVFLVANRDEQLRRRDE